MTYAPESIPLLALILATPLAAQGVVPYSSSASYESYSAGVATGGALADIDGDGHPDFIVANGNDILRQKVEVFTNDGAGNFPLNPQWSASDVDYHGHLAVGDVDRDGSLDVAVSVFLGAGGFGSKGRAKLYTNTGTQLSATPTWSSADTFFGFSCDLGDADSDGDLDLAVATGEPYFDPPDRNRIYYNGGTTLATAPGWLSSVVDHALDVSFGDADSDGDLDLAFATAAGPTRVYYQGPGGMSTVAGWTATDSTTQFGNTIVWRDVDADGFRELAVSDNDQLSGGAGLFKIYDNIGGALATTPFWSDFGGQVSAIAFADLDLDGLDDLAGGIWFAGARIYLNTGGSFPASQDWSSTKLSTVEALVFGDVDAAGVQDALGEMHAPSSGRTYYVDHAPIHELLGVRVDGATLAASQYSYDLEDGWIALGATPLSSVEIDYRWSDSLDLAVTSWDSSIGNLVYRRMAVPRAIFRNDSLGANPAVYQASAPRIGKTWTASVDNTGLDHTLAAVLGYATPLEFLVPAWGTVLVNVLDPAGELLHLPAGVGGGSVGFSGLVPNDSALLGFSLATQGIGFGGGICLYNAYDLVVGI